MSDLLRQPQSESTDATGVAGSAPVDVIIVTFNEEVNLPHTLKSIQWARRIFVVDAMSTDKTCELAREFGAEVIRHPWEGYARQKNWALDTLGLESPWTLILDADEAVPQDLAAEIVDLCRKEPSDVAVSGFYLNRALVFMDKRIRYCGYNPSWNLRLFKRGLARYEDRPVHEHMILRGPAGYLKGLLHHEDRRGLEYYIAKHNHYSTLEAQTRFQGEAPGGQGVQAAALGNAIERRRWFRTHIYPRLPARWLGRFLWMYVLRLGFLDGLNGLHFCLLIASHELFATLKYQELRQRAATSDGVEHCSVHRSGVSH